MRHVYDVRNGGARSPEVFTTAEVGFSFSWLAGSDVALEVPAVLLGSMMSQ